MNTLSNSDVIAICSMVIAALAFFVAIFQIYLSKKHNILSVKPEIDIRVYALNTGNFKMALINNGLGTAFLRSVSFKINNCRYSLFKEAEFKKFAEQLRKEIPDRLDLNCYLFDYSSSLSNAGELLIFEVQNSPELIEKLRKTMKHVQLEVEYQSLYKITYKKSLFVL